MMELDKLNLTGKLTRSQLMQAIQKDLATITMNERIKAMVHIKDDAQYLPRKERESYIKTTNKTFIKRLDIIKNDNNKYKGNIDTEKLGKFFKVSQELIENPYNENELAFQKIAKIVATYAAFIKMESIHQIGTRFPGNLQLIHTVKGYLCPVKEKQLKNPTALCHFCVALQNENNF